MIGLCPFWSFTHQPQKFGSSGGRPTFYRQSPFFEITFVLARLDYVAAGANHGIM
jgi:hypothetical protein